eukprot:scaffold106231_cov17-Tisochrysis_lutea.AAC.1
MLAYFQPIDIYFTHSLPGIVPSNPGLALLQWAGRSNVLFLVLGKIPEVSAYRVGIAAICGYFEPKGVLLSRAAEI